MSLPRSIRWSLVPAVAGVLTLVMAFAPRSRAESRAVVRPASLATEVPRIRAHFDSVLTELRARDVRALTVTQRDARRALLITLSAYRDRGRFPRNYDFAAPTPYFVDRQTGVLCAVAHLLESTGRRDIVDRVAAANNNVWVPQLAGDTAFASWLNAHGITLAEAARIQVPYQSATTQVATVAYIGTVPLLAASSIGFSVWNAWGNADGQHASGRILGLTSGVLSLGIGAGLATQMDNGAPRSVVGTLAALGGISTGLAIRAMTRHHRIQTIAARDSAAARAIASPQASIAPILPQRGRNGAGVQVAVRF